MYTVQFGRGSVIVFTFITNEVNNHFAHLIKIMIFFEEIMRLLIRDIWNDNFLSLRTKKLQ